MTLKSPSNNRTWMCRKGQLKVQIYKYYAVCIKSLLNFNCLEAKFNRLQCTSILSLALSTFFIGCRSPRKSTLLGIEDCSFLAAFDPGNRDSSSQRQPFAAANSLTFNAWMAGGQLPSLASAARSDSPQNTKLCDFPARPSSRLSA